MKKLLVALGFTMAAMSAQASLVFNFIDNTIAINNKNNITGDEVDPITGFGTTYQYGTLSADAGDIVTFQNASANAEAGFRNLFINGVESFENGSNLGTIQYLVTTTGLLNFSFVDEPGVTFGNGSSSIGVIGDKFGGFLLLLNDSGNGDDFDDHAAYVSAVPVPAALPLMASALGIFGLSRRKSKKAA